MTSLSSDDGSASRGAGSVFNHVDWGLRYSFSDSILAKTKTLNTDVQLQKKCCVRQNYSWYSPLLLLCCERKVKALLLFVEGMDKKYFWRRSFGFGVKNKQSFLPADLVWICDFWEGVGLLCFH